MAKYIKDDNGKVSGRTGGNVYGRNGIVRKMAFTARSFSAAALAIKVLFSQFNSSFRALGQAGMASWNGYSIKRSDVFAQPVNVKGKQAYVSLNINASRVGGAEVTAPPLADVSPTPTITGVLTATIATLSLAYTVNPDGATTVIAATPSMSAATFKPSKNDFRDISVEDTSAAGPANIFAAYSAKFGAPVVGAKIFVFTKVIDAATGLASLESVSEVIVA